MILSELSDIDLSYFGIKDNFFTTDNLINFIKFFSNKSSLFIHVEDKGKANFYSKLFNKLFPKIPQKNYYILDIHDGKEAIINIFNELKQIFPEFKVNNFFILDKDFDNIYPKTDKRYIRYKNLKKEKTFLILKRYCIENYLINDDLIKKFCFSHYEAKHKDSLIKNIKKIRKYTLYLSKYQYLNQLFETEDCLEINYYKYINIKKNNFEVKVSSLLKFIRDLSKGLKINNCNKKKYCINEICDINGKKFLEVLVHSLGKCSREYNQNFIQIEPFKNHLIEYSSDGDDFKILKKELKQIFSKKL